MRGGCTRCHLSGFFISEFETDVSERKGYANGLYDQQSSIQVWDDLLTACLLDKRVRVLVWVSLPQLDGGLPRREDGMRDCLGELLKYCFLLDLHILGFL